MFGRISEDFTLSITTGDIPSLKLFESEKTLAFLDINPLA